MKRVNDKKGFTLMELIVVLGLTAIVIAVVMSFFIANYKSYETINTESELQYQSQYIINFMTDKILEVKEFRGEDATTGKFIFEYADSTELTFKKDDKEIEYKYKDDSPDKIGNYVKDLDIKTNPEASNSVIIVLTLEDNKPVEQVIYMRNSMTD